MPEIMMPTAAVIMRNTKSTFGFIPAPFSRNPTVTTMVEPESELADSDLNGCTNHGYQNSDVSDSKL